MIFASGIACIMLELFILYKSDAGASNWRWMIFDHRLSLIVVKISGILQNPGYNKHLKINTNYHNWPWKR